jgi:hypothetical protein
LRHNVGQRTESFGEQRIPLVLHKLNRVDSLRDIQFDIENDPNRCLHNLSDSNIFAGTADARRIPEIFENPVFYSGAGGSVDFVQGAVEDCYLVSALSTMTFMDRLIHNLCVAVSFRRGFLT